MVCYKEQLLPCSTQLLWKRIGIYPHHGIDVFLPALRSANSSGIGEFLDLLPLINWCHLLKMDVIQLLPLNDTAHDPSPYNPLSSCALNFIHLSLYALPYVDELVQLKNLLKNFKHLNETKRIAYTDVLTHKTSWLQTYFDAVGKKLMAKEEYTHFVRQNKWLERFALFRSLKDALNNSSWLSWPQEIKAPSKETYQALLKRYAPVIAFYSLMQFLCYDQLKMVKEYASKKNVLLKGDIPILISRESAEAWYYPAYFDTTLAAGAPPDFYFEEGQYWGFPLFRWDALYKDHFSWWKERLRYFAEFFDLFRIDHTVGFFRIWAIALDAPAKQGYYIPENQEQWEIQGRKLLNMLICNANTMMPIAEDLGTIPAILPIVLQEMGICGTKVMRWQRYWQEDSRFIPYAEYNPLSLTCVSTHDSETLGQWWVKRPEESIAFAQFKGWDYTTELSPAYREQILWDSHHTHSLFHINLLQEYLALFPELIWPHLDDERINLPGTVLPTNWTYRYRPTVEQITSHPGLLQKMQKILFSQA